MGTALCASRICSHASHHHCDTHVCSDACCCGNRSMSWIRATIPPRRGSCCLVRVLSSVPYLAEETCLATGLYTYVVFLRWFRTLILAAWQYTHIVTRSVGLFDTVYVGIDTFVSIDLHGENSIIPHGLNEITWLEACLYWNNEPMHHA